MTVDQVIKGMDSLGDQDLVDALSAGKAILDTRFAEQQKSLAANQKRLLAQAASGKSRIKTIADQSKGSEKGGKNALSEVA